MFVRIVFAYVLLLFGMAVSPLLKHYQKETVKHMISDTLAEKYLLKKGDTLKLKDKYGDTKYNFKIKGIYTYPAALSVFMSEEYFKEQFKLDENYFNGYFSNEELTDIDENYIASLITEDDLTKISRQLDVSMGEMFIIGAAAYGIVAILQFRKIKKVPMDEALKNEE